MPKTGQSLGSGRQIITKNVLKTKLTVTLNQWKPKRPKASDFERIYDGNRNLTAPGEMFPISFNTLISRYVD